MIVSLKSCSLGNATFMELTSNNVKSSQLSQLDFIIWALLLSPYLFGLWICRTPCVILQVLKFYKSKYHFLLIV